MEKKKVWYVVVRSTRPEYASGKRRKVRCSCPGDPFEKKRKLDMRDSARFFNCGETGSLGDSCPVCGDFYWFTV